MRRIVRALTTPAAISSAIYYFGNFFLGFGRYLLHFILLHLLMPEEYGEFLAYLSLIYLLAIPNTIINNITTKYVSEFYGRKDELSINQFFYFALRRIVPYSLLLGILLIVFSGQLSEVFKARQLAFIVLGISLFINFVGTLIRSYMNALQMFTSQIIIGVFDSIITISLTIFFIDIGLSATGVVVGQLTANLISTVVILFIIRQSIFPKSVSRVFELSGFAGYSLVFAIGSISLISVDVLLVRHFFSEHISGIYSSLSVLGRMIYFGLGPLITMILPIAAHRHAANGSSREVFVKLGAVTFLFGLAGTAIFVLFPQLIVSLFSGVNYSQSASLLPIFAIFILLFSFNIFLISYLTAVERPEVNVFLLIASISQPILVYFFHQSVSQVIWINLIIQLILLLPLCREVRKLNVI